MLEIVSICARPCALFRRPTRRIQRPNSAVFAAWPRLLPLQPFRAPQMLFGESVQPIGDHRGHYPPLIPQRVMHIYPTPITAPERDVVLCE